MKEADSPACLLSAELFPLFSSPITHKAILFASVACSWVGGLPRGTTLLQTHLEPLHVPF